MDILKIATAGSVDAGKSTLIGRLLYDTKSVTKDKLDAVELSSKRKGLGFLDLSLLTDGLIAERAQGITIDVAHIYFSTPARKYIIADAPGHFEYTRNMITGASNASAFIVLIDATIGVTEQTKRHLFIASLLDIETVFICINKMDAVDYDEAVFNALKEEAAQLFAKTGSAGRVIFIPVAAKNGGNVVIPSANMRWYNGRSLLQWLEELPVHKKDTALPLRMPVQFVIPHPQHQPAKNSYAGVLQSGVLVKGQPLMVLPSLQKTIAISILHAGKPVGEATAGQSITLELEGYIRIGRGDMIVDTRFTYTPVNNITATLCWLDEQPMAQHNGYLLQHGVNTVTATITRVESKIDIHSMEAINGDAILQLNDVGTVAIRTDAPIFADAYKSNPRNGTFILIDTSTNNTVAVGFIEQLS
jgi:sulfate adenylyltransferase subunit 1